MSRSMNNGPCMNLIGNFDIFVGQEERNSSFLVNTSDHHGLFTHSANRLDSLGDRYMRLKNNLGYSWIELSLVFVSNVGAIMAF